MPFTLSHPAAVLPFRVLFKRWTNLSALVIGSTAPDFAYVLPLGLTGPQTHRLAAQVWFCLPVGLAAFVLFAVLLKRPLVHLLPRPLRLRLLPVVARRARPTWRAAGIVVLSLMLGSLTHVGWDSFTHSEGAGVRAWPALRAPLGRIGPYQVRVYKALQHGSTVLGLVVIVGWLVVWLRRTPVPAETPDSRVSARGRLLLQGGLVGLPVAAGVLGAWLAVGVPRTLAGMQSFAHRAAATGLAVLAGGLVVLGLVWAMVAAARGRETAIRPGGAAGTARGESA